MVCKVCGNNIKSDYKYCPYCGERIINDFHDQFHGLTPPFIIQDIPQEEDAAAQLYVCAPEEAELDFDPEPILYDDLPEEAPYFVCRPEYKEMPAFEEVLDHPVREMLRQQAEKEPQSSMNVWKKLLLIFLILLTAAGVTIAGYQLYKLSMPFENTDQSAVLASETHIE